jgi:hypothetical protein
MDNYEKKLRKVYQISRRILNVLLALNNKLSQIGRISKCCEELKYNKINNCHCILFQYYQCNQGVPTEHWCEGGTVWVQELKRCDWPENSPRPECRPT